MHRLLPLVLLTLMTAVPSASDLAAAAAADDVTVLPCPLGPDTDVWVLAGQSNMQGAGVLTRSYVPNPKVMMLDLSNVWMPAVPPVHRVYTAVAPVYKNTIMQKNPTLTETDWARIETEARRHPAANVGLAYFFACELVGATGRPVALVPCALGSTTMADWDPAGLTRGDQSLYGAMIRRVRMTGAKPKGLLWYQGESDASAATVDRFRTAFLHFVDCVRRDTGIPDLPVLYVQIARMCLANQADAPAWEQVRELQRTMASERRNLWVVPAIDLPQDDYIHVGEAGHERLGHRLAEVALTHVYGLTGHGTPLDFRSYELLPPIDDLHHKMRVNFSGVTGHLQAPGRASGFEFRSEDPKKDGPMIYKVEADPEHPDAVIIWYSKPLTAPVRLYYAAGLDPYANLTDSLDMAVPAFGPIQVQPAAAN